VKRIVVLVLVLVMLAGCGSQAVPTATPDRVATEVAMAQSVAATLTAAAPAAPTQAPPTCVAPATATAAPPPTLAPSPTPLPPPAPTSLPVGPSQGQFAVAGVYSDDVLNVRAAPGPDQRIVGTIPYYGRGVEAFAGDQKVGESWWVPVLYGTLSGWANRSYLARQVGDVGDDLAAQAAQAILALRDHDMPALAGLVHPVKGVTFSPYTYVHPLQGQPGEADLVFSRDQLQGLWDDPTVYHWGAYDGSGLPIDLTFQEYYAEFVYDVDFAQPEQIGFGEVIGQGNTINNIADVWPNAVTVEYHFSGFDPQYAGMDWRSLRLVFEQADGVWALVGIVHDQWTI
jgi:hypothetical protein